MGYLPMNSPCLATFRVAAAVAVAGCGGAGNDDPACVLGTGDCSFVDIQPGDPVNIVLGSQGLYYFPGSVLLRNVPFDNVALHFSLSFEGGAVINAVDVVADLYPLDPSTLPGASARVCTAGMPAAGADGAARMPFCLPGGADHWGETLGQFVLIGNDRYHAVLGARITMRVDGMDAKGHPLSDQHTLVAKAARSEHHDMEAPRLDP